MKYDVVRIMPDGVLAAVHLPLPSFIEAQELRSTFSRLYPENKYTVVEAGALPVYHGTTTGRISVEAPNHSQRPQDLVSGEEKFSGLSFPPVEHWNIHRDRTFNARFVMNGKAVAFARFEIKNDYDFHVRQFKDRGFGGRIKNCTVELYCRRTGELLRTMDMKNHSLQVDAGTMEMTLLEV